MPRVRITGIVRTANEMRDALSQPVTPTERDALARRLQNSMGAIDAILRRHGAKPNHLPAPSRRAYAFLKQLDLSAIPLAKPSEKGAPTKESSSEKMRPESVRFRGLRVFLDRLLDDIARTLHADRFNAEATHRVIHNTCQRLNHQMQREGLKAAHLKPASRDIIGWFRWFAGDKPFDTYVDAVQRGQKVFAKQSTTQTGWTEPLLIHYRPSSHLYSWNHVRDGTRITLLTPMITFDDEMLHRLGRVMTGGRRHWPAVTTAMLDESYQSVAVELETAAGIVERTRGIAYDLADVFDRVNRRYFHGKLPRPKLTWSRTLTGCKFGHYEFISDTVMISSSLDHADVPVYVIDHVMHHELLHKKHGMKWQGYRQHAHTPAFRAEERTFEHYSRAVRFLDSLAEKTA